MTQEVLCTGTFKLRTFKDANMCPVNVRRGPAAGPPSAAAGHRSALPSPTSPPLLQSVSLLACSLDASPGMPAVILYHSTFQVMSYQIKNVLFVGKVL